MHGLEQTISDAICLINRLVVGGYRCGHWAADIQRRSKHDFLMLLSVDGSQPLHLWLALQHQSLLVSSEPHRAGFPANTGETICTLSFAAKVSSVSLYGMGLKHKLWRLQRGHLHAFALLGQHGF